MKRYLVEIIRKDTGQRVQAYYHDTPVKHRDHDHLWPDSEYNYTITDSAPGLDIHNQKFGLATESPGLHEIAEALADFIAGIPGKPQAFLAKIQALKAKYPKAWS